MNSSPTRQTASALILAFIATSLVFCTRAEAQVTAGTGTAGKIPLWNGPHSLTNSIITQTSNKIGIGTTAPSALFTVVGATVTPAIFAVNYSGYAVRGNSDAYAGVFGVSNSSIGAAGLSTSGIGVSGTHSATTGTAPGVQGSTSSNDGGSAGVYGIATSNGYGLHGKSKSGFGVFAESMSSYGGYFSSSTSDAADFHGASWGIYVRNTGAQPAVDGGSSGANSYAGYFISNQYRAGYFKSGSTGLYSLYVDSAGGPSQATSALEVNGSIRAEGNLFVAGSKAGYVVDEMQNADSVALEPGDVVSVAADASAPVLGKIPVPVIRRATAAYDTAVVGVVDQIMYVPAPARRVAYEQQQQADRQAAAQAQALAAIGQKQVDAIPNAQDRISDEVGTMHSDVKASKAEYGRYCSVVTLGSYPIIKVDANYGPIRAGDLLTTSPHAGYAMKVTDKLAASGAIIGKALSSLAGGTGTVSILVTLK